MSIPTADLSKIYTDDPNLNKAEVQSLQEWTAEQPHLPKISELQIILFLQSCYYDNELAKTAIDKYFTFKTSSSNIFGNRDPTDLSLQAALNCTTICILPQLTAPPERHTVMFIKIVDSNPSNFNLSYLFKQFDMIAMLQLYRYGPQNGFRIIFDMNGVVFGHLTKFSYALMKKMFYYLQEAMPIRLKSIHYINAVSFVDKVLYLVKPFMKKEVYEMLHVHADGMESLYKFVPKECLPAEYGGQADTLQMLCEKVKKDLNDNVELFQYEDSQVVDESKIPGNTKKTGSGNRGTRKLEFD